MATNPYSNSYYNPYGQGLFGAQYLPQITDPGPVNETPYSLLNHVQLGGGGGGARGGGGMGSLTAQQQQGLLSALTAAGGSSGTNGLMNLAFNGNQNGPGLSSLIGSMFGPSLIAGGGANGTAEYTSPIGPTQSGGFDAGGGMFGGLGNFFSGLFGSGGVNAAGYGIGSWAPSAADSAGYASDLGNLFVA